MTGVAALIPSPQRALFDDVAGHLLVRGCYLGEWARFRVVGRDGACHYRAVQVKRRVIRNDDPLERICAVAPGGKHRICWLTGPMARAHLIAQIPEARRWHRRQRVKAWFLKLIGGK